MFFKIKHLMWFRTRYSKTWDLYILNKNLKLKEFAQNVEAERPL